MGDMAGWMKLTGARVNFECHNGVTVLIGGEQKGACWIDGEIARHVPLC